MRRIDPTTPFRTLVQRYQQAEAAGHSDVLLAVVFAAGGVATGGVALLTIVQTRAMLIIVYALALLAALAVLLTTAAMVNAEEAGIDGHAPTPASDDRDAPATANAGVSAGHANR